MNINFSSINKKINYESTCLNTDIFAEIEEKLYKKYPEYRETNNDFLHDGKKILRFKTIDDNKIKSGDQVILVIPS